MSGNVETNVRPQPDDVLVKIADYVLDKNMIYLLICKFGLGNYLKQVNCLKIIQK